MVLNTFTVGAAVTPTVLKTYTSHYLYRKPRAQKPTAHISYDEGLNLIRQFLNYASHHSVEEIQGFTAQWVPSPRWVKTEDVEIAETELSRAADALNAQLGHKGIDRVGGKLWWQWRRDKSKLRAEWIEMRSDYHKRKKKNEESKRVMLYVHGGAYFFGSVDEHRYQLQRHARKLKARVFAPRYRLAPQFPFPCGLHDCLAAYLYLLTVQDPTTIILAGDSAGGGMVVSMLVTLRDQGIPLPAGAILISPWVDLTHSFPSVAGKGEFDYIPSHGFMQRPSMAWPPPNADDMQEIAKGAVDKLVQADMPRKSTHQERVDASEAATRGFSVKDASDSMNPRENKNNPAGSPGARERPGDTIPGPGHNLSIVIDDKLIEIKDQIQMYTTNQLISHPLVSPIMQASLGGLPPLMILTGGGEVLRDEQIYLAHKAANPSKYPPSEAFLDANLEAREVVDKYKPTEVQLQVWEDLCHVAPTLSFTRPAKFMFRSIAQFGAWVLARAQHTEIDILDDDDVSVISSESESESSLAESDLEKQDKTANASTDGAPGRIKAAEKVGKAGDPLPHFKNHMIRQKVDRHGNIYRLAPAADLPALQMSVNEIGVIKPGPVRKWMTAKKEWDTKYKNQKRRVQKQRIKEIAKGYRTFGDDDVPPPSALAGRRGMHMPEEKKTRSLGLSLWSLWGSSHDEKTIEREEKADREPEQTAVTADGSATPKSPGSQRPGPVSRSRSRHRAVTYQDQIAPDDVGENITMGEILHRHQQEYKTAPLADHNLLSPSFVPLPHSPATENSNGDIPLILAGTNVTLDSATGTRPKADGVAFPFKLGHSLQEHGRNASMVTLKSDIAAPITPNIEAGEENRGLGSKANKEEGVANRNNEIAVGGGLGERPERPGIERFETAQEDVN